MAWEWDYGITPLEFTFDVQKFILDVREFIIDVQVFIFIPDLPIIEIPNQAQHIINNYFMTHIKSYPLILQGTVHNHISHIPIKRLSLSRVDTGT